MSGDPKINDSGAPSQARGAPASGGKVGSWQGMISGFSSTWALCEVSPRCLVREIQGGDEKLPPAETRRNHDFRRSKRNASVGAVRLR
jgi:hypothetical protein